MKAFFKKHGPLIVEMIIIGGLKVLEAYAEKVKAEEEEE